jgi:two-component system sensor histidine kinase ChvG
MSLAVDMPPSRPEPSRPKQADVVLGEDWVRPQGAIETELRDRRARRGFISLNRSPLARKIIFFNLLALVVLVAGVLYVNPFRESLVLQREASIAVEAELIAGVMAAAQDETPLAAIAAGVPLHEGLELFVFDTSGTLAAQRVGTLPHPARLVASDSGNFITGFLNSVWTGLERLFGPASTDTPTDVEGIARALFPAASAGETRISTTRNAVGEMMIAAAAPITAADGAARGVVAIASAAGEIDAMVRNEREQVLQMFLVALVVSIGLSLVLASTIANPLADLAAAAEIGRDKNARRNKAARVRIPDLAGRPDEIGRLSVAMRGMVAALYDRLEANEQFAADVAHEIKNPLASLRSAVGTLRVAKRDDQRQTLLDVIDHDVRRLDRLVSDISNASRLDSELVKEQEESFDILKMLRNLSEYLGKEAESKGVEFIIDLPESPLVIQGLEARLAQVFVNLITNAVSFCEDGDAVRVWARSRENRVLIVVEDTGPGIPEQALTKVFKRFYSERPVQQFGNHSGLGLAISKQIVEAHGGVIWAENIRPTDADPTSDPLGARFVVGLPL